MVNQLKDHISNEFILLTIQSLIYLIPLCHKSLLFSKSYFQGTTLLHYLAHSFITMNMGNVVYF